MEVAVAAAVGAALALVSRGIALFLHRRWFRQGFAGDSSIHLVIIRTLRRRPSARWVEEYLISPEPMVYPTGFHRFAALFPVAKIEARPWLPNLVVWVAALCGYGAYGAYVAHSVLHIAVTSFVSVALAFVLLVPSAIVFRGPAIAYLKLSERLLGRLATSFAVLFLAVGTIGHDRASLAGALVAVMVAATSSIFARQALAFGLPPLALLWWSWQPLAVLAAGAVLALALSGRRFLGGLRHTWIQWRLYPRHTKASRHARAMLSAFAGPPAVWRAFRARTGLRALVTDREPMRAIMLYPEIILAGGLLAARAPSYAWRWAAPLAVFTALYVLTSTDRFNHLGESYRYLEFGLTLLVPMEIALVLQTYPVWTRIACLFAVAVWSGSLGLTTTAPRGWMRTIPERDALADFLERVQLRPGDVVFPVTVAMAADICARVDGVKSFWWQPGLAPLTSIYDEFIEELPYLKRNYRPLIRKYGVTHVIFEKAALDRIDWTYDFSWLTPIAEDDRYAAFRVPGYSAA